MADNRHQLNVLNKRFELNEITGSLNCSVTATSPSGLYDITKGTFANESQMQEYHDAETDTYYYYQLIYVGAEYVVTNAIFSAAIGDVEMVYTGEP